MNLLFAWRYFRAKKSTNAINIIAWVSMSAIVVGAASLILVLAVFNGFEDLVKSLYISFYPDIKVTAGQRQDPYAYARTDSAAPRGQGVQALSLVVEEQVLLHNESNPPQLPI